MDVLDPAIVLADARLGFFNDDWSVVAYLNNIFDDNTISSSGGNTDLNSIVDDPSFTAIPASVATAFLPPPRTLGIRLSRRF